MFYKHLLFQYKSPQYVFLCMLWLPASEILVLCVLLADMAMPLIFGSTCVSCHPSYHHHHHVPSSCWGLDAKVLHSWRCCACLTAWWYSSPVHLVMFVVHFVLGLPHPLVPFTLPSKTVRCSVSPFWRMMCPKYCIFLFAWCCIIFSWFWLFLKLLSLKPSPSTIFSTFSNSTTFQRLKVFRPCFL